MDEVSKYPYGDGGEVRRPIQKTEQSTPTATVNEMTTDFKVTPASVQTTEPAKYNIIRV